MMKYFCYIISLFPITCLYSQVDTTFNSQGILNSILEESTIETEDSQLYELIEELLNNPININNSSTNDLLKIPTMDLQTAQAIIEHRNKYGKYFSVRELYSIENINNELLENIIPFLTIAEKKEITSVSKIEENYFKDLQIDFRSRLINDLQNKRGFIEEKYEGNKLKLYNRLKTELNNFRINLLAEKDAGEKSISDFTSFSFAAEKVYLFDEIIAGDYLIEFGQGLTLWGPYAFSKGSEAVSSVTRNARGLIPYSSSDENQFFRGGAVKFSLSNIDFSLFYSSNNIDANLSDENFITSTPVDGYHRTINEINKKDKVNEKSIGTILNYSPFQNSQIGFLFYRAHFSNSFEPKQIYDLKGSEFNFYSISYSTIFDRFYFNGEVAYNGTSTASINNLQITLNKTFSLAASVRSYPRNFYNLHSNGFGESSNTQNEFGIYTGIKAKFSSTQINFYYDQYKSPFASYSSSVSIQGYEFLFDVLHKFSSKVKTRLRYKRENIENKNISHKFRMELIYNLSKTIRLKSRIEWTDITIDDGFLTFQDIRFSHFENLIIYSRLIFFDTESYISRVYEFENDLTGVLNNMALFGKGTRWYLLINYKFFNNFKLSAKYSETFKPEETRISSGLNEIAGSFQSRFSLQLDYNF